MAVEFIGETIDDTDSAHNLILGEEGVVRIMEKVLEEEWNTRSRRESLVVALSACHNKRFLPR